MAPFNASSGLSLAGRELANGWVKQPDGRGTIDVVWSCAITILLCSWSVLCLNVPAVGEPRIATLMHKFRWWAFTIFFPEVVTALAQEQWLSAGQSVSDFRRLGYTSWTMPHAFFANMGGFLLESPDFPVIPIDARQLYYLVERGYLAFPDVCRQTIWDKNKADRFTRAITVLQTLWFGLQCLVRRAQNLPISTFELSTLAFVFCMIPTSFFWYFKPLDVEAPIVLRTDTRIADILIDAGDAVNKRYTQTPLDFINPPSQASLLTVFFFSLQCVGISGSQKSRPIKAFPNSKMTPPRDLSAKAAALAPVIGLGYTAIHLIGWNYPFPTFIEQTFWRVASSLLMGLVSIYLVFLAVGKAVAATLARRLYNADASTALEFLALCPWLIQMLFFVSAIATYSLARLYIIIEGFVSLRALPLGVYVTSDWLDFIPHF